MAVDYSLMVVGTGDQNTEYKTTRSPLRLQTRYLTTFPNKEGFLVGSIEGRVGVNHLNQSQDINDFTFKCHQDGEKSFPCQLFKVYPVHHTFACTGIDGTINFWDKNNRPKLKQCDPSVQEENELEHRESQIPRAFDTQYQFCRQWEINRCKPCSRGGKT